jgi:hemerythrin superfamily protein
MKVTDLLKKDHDTVKKMFAAFEKMGAKVKEKRSSQAEEICEELRIHATVEEEIFYPAVKSVRDKQAVRCRGASAGAHADQGRDGRHPKS